jgi:prolyl-tRNA synthetase
MLLRERETVMATNFIEEPIDVDDDQFDQWFVDVIKRAGMMDNSPVAGCRVFKPYGYGLWENMQRQLDDRFKETGVENAYFPLFIPESMLAKEAEHIEGFAPEVAWVTMGGNRQLEERLAIRPSSESIICPIFAEWVQSYRDLPILINQWCSVVRWEERPRSFLRTREFLWQEGHTAHATAEEAEERALQMIDVYNDFYVNELAIPSVMGRKSDSERFAGALRTYTLESMMRGKRWALQSCTSHNLGDHFGKSFNIQFLAPSGEREYAWNTSWGLSWRAIGAIIMVHGDQSGLQMPPRVAPVQAVVVPIWRTDEAREQVFEASAQIERALKAAGVRVKVDRDPEHTPGWKFNEWELKGVPVRIEVGPRDVAAGQAVLVRRDNRQKEAVPLEGLAVRVQSLLDDLHTALYQRALDFQKENSAVVTSYDELKERVAANAGFSYIFWDGDPVTEEKIKQETKATIRCIPLHDNDDEGPDLFTGKTVRGRVLVDRAY